jgi:hypothetical protein
MQTQSFHRFLPIAGVLMAILIAVAFGLTSGQPDESASVTKAFSYWGDHGTETIASTFAYSLAAVLLVLFGAGLRIELRSRESGEASYSTIAFGGALITAVSFLIAAMLALAAATAADQGAPAATYAIGQLTVATWVPFTAGLAVLLIAVGLGGLRTLAFPKALSWAALAIGIIALTPFGWATFALFPFWSVAAGIVLYRREAGGGSGASAAHAVPG